MIESNSNALRLAQSHFNRMDMVGTPATATMRDALKTLLLSLDADIGLSKFHRIMPYIGGTAATHALEIFGNDITWGGTVTHDANGITGNGSTGHGVMAMDLNTELGESNGSASSYVIGTHADVQQAYLGAFFSDGGASERYYQGYFTSTVCCAFQILNFTSELAPPSTSPEARGPMFLSSTITTSKACETWKDGVSLGTSTSTGNMPDGPSIAILGIINNNTAGITTYSSANLAFQHIGDALTDAEHVLLAVAVEAFQVTLGREN